ncbi:Gfo/Idh/MocA family oxidoreductase [Candidatus Caldatribacterium saccharofermentans]|uniref:Gfo/Idh/MocA family oxidoreductase n=1 Tax=Candidatus Caldatribacterium saccharofermentans TaxID=1454753 RepID=A0A7V4WKE1_9BACT
MRRTLKVGVIGTGFIGPAHIEAARRTFLAEVVALADINEDVACRKANDLAVELSFGDYQELLRQDHIEVVHICTPNHLHYTMAKEALLAGKHVVCEKPLAMNRREAEELVELAEKVGRVHAVHFNVRFYPLVREARSLVSQGKVGKIFAIHGSYLQDWLFYETDYNWRLEPELSGPSRAVADIGSHWLDLVEYISGQRVVEVFADFATFHKTRKKPLKPVETYAGKILKPEDYETVPITTEDYASVLLHFDGGAHGVMTVNQVAAGRKNRITYEIDGSLCALFWDSERPNELWIGRRDKANELLMKDPSLVSEATRQIISFPGGHNEGFPDTSKHFFREVYSAILEARSREEWTFPTFVDGLREVVLCEAILESARKGTWVQVR